MTVHPITPTFAAEVGGVDLGRGLDDECFESIKQAFWQYSVLVFPDQQLNIEQHLEFARRFGSLETTVAQYRPGQELRTPPEIADVSNLNQDNTIWAEDSPRRLHELGNRLWHTDSSFRPNPAFASFLYARSIPPVGGHTEFADGRAAYEALDPATQDRLHGAVAEHCIRYSRARIGFTDFSEEESVAMPPVPQSMIRTIPESDRKTLYLASHAGRVLGMPDDAGRAWIDELI